MIRLVIIFLVLVQFGYSKNYYGIVIGCCSKYANEDLPALHAKNDAESFYNILLNMYPNIKLHLLTERKATRENIKSTLKQVAQEAKSNDVVYFFYSGHGSSLADKSNIIKVSYRNNALVKAMENSGLLVPYNFRFKDVLHTAIIGSQDLRENGGFGFQYLDKKRVRVIMISDSCFAGNLYRTGNHTTSKYIPISERINQITANANRPKRKDFYNNLIFFSAGGTTKVVAEDDRLKRGKFTLALEKCLKRANQNRDRVITKRELKECLRTEDRAKAFVLYPVDRLANQAVFKASNEVSIPQEDKIRVKTAIRGLERVSNQIIIDNKNYDIEIVQVDKNRYKIYRYTGEEYADVTKSHLAKYLHALKLFKLKGKKKLNVEVLKDKTEMRKFCYGEELTVDIKDEDIGRYIVALTLDNQGKVIMLQPNDYEKVSLNIVKMRVQPPEGMDKVKVFVLNSQKQYNQIKKLVVKGGELEKYAIDKLYKILKSDKNYKEADIDIETIDRPISYCKQGE